jgi:hypothetical protein
MATYSATTAGPGKQARAVGWAGTLKSAVGIYEVDVIHVLGDTIEMVKLPKGAVIVGGWLRGDKLDSVGSGSALASINIGVDCIVKTLYNRTSVALASVSNCLLDAWSIGPDAAVSATLHNTAFRTVPLGGLLHSEGPIVTTAECKVIVKWGSSILALTSGTMVVEVQYYMESDS